jgi:hypothetical protein
MLDRLTVRTSQLACGEIELERPLPAPPPPASCVDEQHAFERSPAGRSRPAADAKPGGVENHRDPARQPRGEDPPFNGRLDPEVVDLGHERLGQLRQSRMLIWADDQDKL